MAVTTFDRTHKSRDREVANAIASLRIEGLEPSGEAKGIFQQYADGELTLTEMGRAVDQLAERQYGPVRLSRNDCS
jgi:hypothetical protein